MDRPWLEAAVILLLILANGFLAASRHALLAVRKTRLTVAADTGDPRAKTASALTDAPEKLILSIQLILTVIGTFVGILCGATLVRALSEVIARLPIAPVAHFSSEVAVILLVLIISALVLLVGEILPRSLTADQALQWSLRSARITRLVSMLAEPGVRLLSTVGKRLAPHGERAGSSPPEIPAEEEIITLVAEGTRTGEFGETEQKLIRSVLEFADTTVRQAMTPRTEVVAINVRDPVDEILRCVREQGYSRYPAFDGTLDQIVGVVFTKDVINILYDRRLFIINDLLRPAHFVPDSRKISELLKDLQARQQHLAVVLDEFGGTAGIITIEDILEEIVGEIRDEYDTEKAEFTLINETTAEVSARMQVDRFNAAFRANLPLDRADTIGGLLLSHLGELPRHNQIIQVGAIEFRIVGLDGHRISKVIAAHLLPS